MPKPLSGLTPKRDFFTNPTPDFEPPDTQITPSTDLDGFISNANPTRPVWRDGQMMVGVFKCTNIGLQLVRDNAKVTDKDMQELGRVLRAFEGSLQWLIGDWVVCAEQIAWGKLEDFANEIGFDYQTIRDYAYVARNVDLSVRTDKLSFGHHKVVASMTPEQQRVWLNQAVNERLTVAQLRALIAPKQLPKGGMDALFSKEKAPKLGELRSLYSKAKNNDLKAREAIKKELEASRKWLKEIAQSLGLE